LDSIGPDIIREINLARTQPAHYAKILMDDRRPYFKGNRLTLPDWKQYMPTAEGIKAVDETIAVLSQTPPMGAVEEWPGMTAAARAAVLDSGAKGAMKKQDSLNRLQDHGVEPAGARVIELLGFGVGNARELVSRLLVADGDPDRYDRRSLLDAQFRFVGVAYGQHQSQYKRMLCINLAEGFMGAPEPNTYPTHDSALQPRESVPITEPQNVSHPLARKSARGTPDSPLVRLEDALNKLNNAVADRAAAEALQAASKLPELVNAFTTDDPNAIGPLNDAVDRLRKLLKALLGMTKDTLAKPKGVENDQLFNKISDEVRSQARIADALSRGDLSVLDTVKTQLAGSGMIEAAAAAARQLQEAFKDN